jgi:hypothetical protein
MIRKSGGGVPKKIMLQEDARAAIRYAVTAPRGNLMLFGNSPQFSRFPPLAGQSYGR